MDIPVVIPSAELVSVSEELSTDVDAREKSEIDLPGVADFDSLRNAPAKEDASSDLIKSLTDAEHVVMILSEVGLEDRVLQIVSEDGTNAGVLEDKAHDEIAQDVKQETFVDGAMGSCAGIKIMDESTACIRCFYLSEVRMFTS